MTPAEAPSVTDSVQINARPETVYALVTDLDVLVDLGEEVVAMRWRRAAGARPGAVFSGANRNGRRRWSTTCTVTDADAGRRFGFDVRAGVIPVAHWAYTFEAVDGGCRVTESTWDRRPGWITGLTRLTTGVGDRTAANAEHIRRTLQRLKRRAEAGQRGLPSTTGPGYTL